ncbi:MAG: hypothetical protein ACFFC6_03640 [Promethearchaeota archaeon]
MSIKKLYLLIFWVLALSTISTVSGYESVTLISNNQKNSVTLTITDAYYTDLDDDEVLDIVSSFNLRFEHPGPHLVQLYVTLILPSGLEFSYKWNIMTRESLVHFGQIHFYDHVLEPGFYILSIYTKLSTGGVSTGTAEFEFDPPGGSGGGDPLASMV